MAVCKARCESSLLISPPASEDIPDETEVLRLLGESARAGNVSAMKELRAYHREQANDGDDFISQLEDFANQGS